MAAGRLAPKGEASAGGLILELTGLSAPKGQPEKLRGLDKTTAHIDDRQRQCAGVGDQPLP